MILAGLLMVGIPLSAMSSETADDVAIESAATDPAPEAETPVDIEPELPAIEPVDAEPPATEPTVPPVTDKQAPEVAEAPTETSPTTQVPAAVEASDPKGVTPPASSGTAIKVKRVIDGDTIELFTDETVRILGYDTPERGECGFTKATDSLQALLLSGNVTMTTDDGDDTDRYDSLDGYPRHRYKDDYRNADGPNTLDCASPATPPPATAPPNTQAPAANNGPFANCSEVRSAGRAPIRAGEPGFESKFDRDGDGVGFE